MQKINTYKISGHSMHPLLKDGQIVEVDLNVANLKIDDIVIFRHPFRKIESVKKIIEIKDDFVKVKGENVESEDAIGEIKKEDIIGRVIDTKTTSS